MSKWIQVNWRNIGLDIRRAVESITIPFITLWYVLRFAWDCRDLAEICEDGEECMGRRHI